MFQIRKIAPALLCLSLAACTKDEPNPNNLPTNGIYTTLPATLKGAAAPVQVINVSADSGGSYRIDNGIRFFLPKYAFRTPDGDTVRGTVQITVAQYIDRAEMIYSNVLTDNTDTGDILSRNSAGAFLFLPAQKGLNLQIANGAVLQAYLPQRNLLSANPATSTAQSYLGYKNANIIGEVTWAASGSGLAASRAAFDTLLYRFDTVGYHQSAIPYNFFGTGPSTVRFSLSGVSGLNATNSFLYLLPKGRRSVVDVGNADRLKNRTYKVVDKDSAALVGVAVVNGRFYGGISNNLSLQDNRSYGVSMTEQNPESFKALVGRIY